MSDDNYTMKRRKFLGGVAAGATTATAGCISVEGDVDVKVKPPKVQLPEIRILLGEADEKEERETPYRDDVEPVRVTPEPYVTETVGPTPYDTPEPVETATPTPRKGRTPTTTEHAPVVVEKNNHRFIARDDYSRIRLELYGDAGVSFSFRVTGPPVEAFVIPGDELGNFDSGEAFDHFEEMYGKVKNEYGRSIVLEDGVYDFIIDYSDRGDVGYEVPQAHIEDLSLVIEYLDG